MGEWFARVLIVVHGLRSLGNGSEILVLSRVIVEHSHGRCHEGVPRLRIMVS